MEREEFMALEGRFRQGVEKLELIGRCLASLARRLGVDVEVEALRKREGELVFWFAGTGYCAKVSLADRRMDDAGTAVTVPVGWLDWGPCEGPGTRGPIVLSSYFDDRGVVFVADREEIYCDVAQPDDQRVGRALQFVLSRMVGRTMALNNARRT